MWPRAANPGGECAAEGTFHCCVVGFKDRYVHPTLDIQMLDRDEAQELGRTETVRRRMKRLVDTGRGGYGDTDLLQEIVFLK